jgi:peroxisomal membrane protein 4
MWLFRNRRERLNAGMVSSMQYLYLDSEVWSGLRNFIWREYISFRTDMF